MPYLFAADYDKQIQADNLQQVIGANTSIRLTAELAAQSEMKSYLVQKYLVDSEFTETQVYDNTKAYKARSRVYLNATPYNQTATYALGDLALQTGKVYRCSTAIGTAEIFNAAHWTLIGNQYTLFYAQLPKTEFDYAGTVYAVGDQVFWKDKTYQAIVPSKILSHEDYIQAFNGRPNMIVNVFPDEPVNGPKQWSDLGAYSVPAGSILNTTYFTQGDNRNQQMVSYMVDIALYHLHSRVASRNVPDIRVDRYHAAIKWLKEAAKGEITADLEKIQPLQGKRIRGGSQTKQINSY